MLAWHQLSQDSAKAMSRAALGVLSDCTKSKAGHLTGTFQSATSPGNKLQETPRESYEPTQCSKSRHTMVLTKIGHDRPSTIRSECVLRNNFTFDQYNSLHAYA